MAIKDLQVKQGNVDIVAEVVEIGEVREFNKFGKPGRVANAKIKDQTGEIELTLWNDDIDKVKVGDTVKITNGYVNEWQGTPQLTSGRTGKLEVVASADEGNTDSETTEEESVEE
jgi:replication factor A1